MTGFLDIGTGDLRIAVSPYGAALARVWLAGFDTSLVLGLPEPEDYADAPHAIGVVVGPIAGRISGARAPIAGTVHHMPANTPSIVIIDSYPGTERRIMSGNTSTTLSSNTKSTTITC